MYHSVPNSHIVLMCFNHFTQNIGSTHILLSKPNNYLIYCLHVSKSLIYCKTADKWGD